MSDLEKKVRSKFGGKEVYDKILSLLVNQLVSDDQLIDIAGQISSKLQSKVKTYISDKKISNTYDRRSSLRNFFREWESMFASTEDEEEKLSTQRLVNILQDPDIDLTSLAREIAEAVHTGSSDSLPGPSGVPQGATLVPQGAESVTHGAVPVLDGDVPVPPGVVFVPSDKDDERYNMNHQRRGLAIIFNHKEFNTMNTRRGTDKDRDYLKETLEDLGFEVDPHQDLTKAEVMSKIDEAAKGAKSNHEDADCLLVAVLTHGGPDFLHSKDKKYNPSKLMEPFTAEKCPTLAGKPKMFFFQACQGKTDDHGVKVQKNPSGPAADGVEPTPYTIPNQVDFLIGCSTVPGYYSWRDPTKGSWYMQALCDQLKLHGYYGSTMKLTDILTRVNRQVAQRDSTKKQSPCFFGTITRDIILTKKN